MAKNLLANLGVKIPVYFQILRNQDCNEQESVLSREAAWPGIFFELTFTKNQEVGVGIFPPVNHSPRLQELKSHSFSHFFCFPKLRTLFAVFFFSYLPFLPPVKNESLQYVVTFQQTFSTEPWIVTERIPKLHSWRKTEYTYYTYLHT